jgi:hypothetical protein
VVAYPGEALHTGTAKPVNTPEPVPVIEDKTGFPAAVGMKKLAVEAVTDRWRLDDEWWRREPISRLYYVVILQSGQRLVIYKDLHAGTWFKQG